MENTPKNPNSKAVNKWAMAGLAFEMGYIIALPLVAFGLLGKFLDAKLETKPWLTLIGILIAIVATIIWFVRKFKNYFNK